MRYKKNTNLKLIELLCSYFLIAYNYVTYFYNLNIQIL